MVWEGAIRGDSRQLPRSGMSDAASQLLRTDDGYADQNHPLSTSGKASPDVRRDEQHASARAPRAFRNGDTPTVAGHHGRFNLRLRLSPQLRPLFIWIKGVGIVHRSLRRPRLAGRRAFRNIGDRVGQGRDTTAEPDPDVGAASVHRLKDGDRLAFLHSLADQRRALGTDIAQLGAAIAEDGNGVLVVGLVGSRCSSTASPGA